MAPMTGDSADTDRGSTWGAVRGAAIPLIGVGAAAGLLLVRLIPDVRGKPIYEDEALAGLVSAHSLPEVLATVHDRGGAPLHFVLASFVLELDPSASALRWLSVVFAVATIPLCYDIGRRLAGSTAGVAAAAVAASSPMLGVYGSFGRMYALFGFVAALAIDLYVLALHERTRRTVVVAAVAAMLLPTAHTFGIVLVGAEALVAIVIWRGRNLSAATPLLLIGLVLIPLAAADLRLVNRFGVGLEGEESVARPLDTVRVTASALRGFGAGGVVSALFVILALAGTVELWRRAERSFVALAAIATLALPVGLIVAHSGHAAAPQFSPRHLIFALPLWAALAGCGFAAVTRRVRRPGWIVLIVALSAAALLAPSPIVDPRSSRSGSRELLAAPASWLRDQIEPNAILFPSSPVFLAALPAARHAQAVSREQPILITRALRRAHLPAPAAYVAVPLGEAHVSHAALASQLGAGFQPRIYPSWLVIRVAGPLESERAVLEQLIRAISGVRLSVDRPPLKMQGYLRQSETSLCGALRSLGGRCA
jgi:hypothetical protein